VCFILFGQSTGIKTLVSVIAKDCVQRGVKAEFYDIFR
jgi:hypothetical protein